ncbi:tRNA (guanosine(37)-N1)-methyltransferase TrmD [Malacoplasma penetrans]|uniref:tRNA (guanine-N(1)-)-methyltransferase n=1 Tax=Malacoplasma penetrans (strain HF-2) TaxID=272633 RepID=TRMD_MALP2|nr:tRNA (guanosine(37)-N1)-methyltransferase TrmD [Malacoplasma penetrans]Q8CXQ6.1 RecName: Full=tRNA (guanine-N(1)-)-methyltransferase; AltName: Full=M1G-methyltransferase; AltName: Full=tRNA [GM37] methyltransferase [Malacoplasma penetrans HF-2]RXY97321.1 tRNA (guanosine(37)-N1)-methyltransferase TrmD [Malacoplasma penetrans]BAC43893.1 tRNA (guanine-N1)-methyltransferase [Malacoplasma penetrans HF-2]
MKITVLSLFENFFNEFKNTSIIKKAIANNLVDIEIVNFRNFSKDSHNKVDDTPYGGGAGMVLTLQPIVDAINHVKTSNSKVVLLTPSGKTYNQQIANQFKTFEHLILICGHYEGFDERIINYVDYEISIGDYILTGGEIAAMAILDSVIRLIPNVISVNSLESESFDNNLLDYPNYTKPYNFNGYKVPEVLLSGNHKEINKVRKEWQINKTKINRKDLFIKYLKEN